MPTDGDQQRRRAASRRPAPTTSGSTGCNRSRPGAWRRCRRPRRSAVRATMAPTRLAATAIFIDTKRKGSDDGQRSFQNICAGAGAVGAHEVEMERVGRAQALHHADGDREERQVGRDQRLGDEAAEIGGQVHLAGEQVEGDHDEDRRQRQDGDGLRGDRPTASGCGRGSSHGRCRRRAGCRAACRRRSRRSVEESVTQAW